MKYIHTPQQSASGRLLARRLRLRRIRGPIDRYPQNAELVLTWGQRPDNFSDTGKTINHPAAQRAASNKIYAFRMMQDAGVSTVPFTLSIDEANNWKAHGAPVVERGTVTGSGGAGIRVVRPGEALRNVQLYTQFVPSVREYRIHVVGDAVLPARKVRRNGTEADPFPIRNHSDTWAFQYDIPEKSPVHESVLTLAKKAIDAVDLDFGAVDILYQGKGIACVLEINTAPGIEHSVAEEFYVRELQGLVNGR